MDPNECKQQFSFAYIHAVASVAGYQMYRPPVDEESVDLVIAAMGKMGTVRSPRLEMQVKCTARDVVREDGIHFPLDVKNYDELRESDYLVDRVLVVVLAPEDRDEWIRQSDEELALRGCGYWVSLKGRSATDNESTVTILLPKEQRLSPDALRTLMARERRTQAENPT